MLWPSASDPGLWAGLIVFLVALGPTSRTSPGNGPRSASMAGPSAS
jgi:hypothetical protein